MFKNFPENILLRPWRLTLLTIAIALAFVYGRLILFAVLGIIILIAAIKIYITQKKSYFNIIIPVLLVLLIVGVYYIIDYNRVAGYMADHSPIDIDYVQDGVYRGQAMGLRGPIITKVSVENFALKDIRIIQDQEAISALDGLSEQLISANSLDVELIPPTIHGSMEAADGFRQSVQNALWKGVPERPEFSAVTRVLHFFSQYRFDMTTLNALAILFCILLVFDYTLQPVLVKGTGQALNCYNCQTCVGVCPVKIVDGEPYPMTMILAARLGDYEQVRYLSRFCVACSRCAGKCPVGDSGPSIAAAANAELIRLKRKELKTSA